MWFPGDDDAPTIDTEKRLVGPGTTPSRSTTLLGWEHPPADVCRSRRFAPRPIEEATLLYFAYTTRIAPDRMAEAAPDAEFEFIAHLPEWGLEFPVASESWGGALPTVTPTTGSTVWGAVFDVNESALAALDEVEGAEQRVRTTVEAMDRMGRRHQVAVHVHDTNGSTNGAGTPSTEYLKIMLDGSRHWSLPAGWIAGLEEHLQGH